jgi:hypothetical protein
VTVQDRNDAAERARQQSTFTNVGAAPTVLVIGDVSAVGVEMMWRAMQD